MSSSRLRRVVATSTLSVALVAGGVVAPTAGAVTTSIKNDKCTITLSEKESNDLSNAESKDNDVDSGLLQDDYEILPKDAEARARAVQNQSDELYRDLADFETEVELGDEDAVKRAKNNIKVAETFRDIAPEYIKALNACAKKEEFNKKKDSDGDNTSSNIDKGGAIILGVSGALTIILMALRAAGPFLKTVLPPQLADMIPA